MQLPIPALSPMPSGRVSRWVSIANALRDAIRSGQLDAGESLPSTRVLARDLGVHRNTVMVALEQLVAEGWVEAQPRRGYRVMNPELAAPRTSHAESERFAFRFTVAPTHWPRPSSARRLRYAMHSATPDPALLPRADLRAAYGFMLKHADPSLFDDLDARGTPRLRQVLLRYLRRVRAIVADDVVLTHGSQAGLSLVGRALLGPGDIVAVEDPGYRPAWEAFRAQGAEICPIPVDDQGLQVDALDRLPTGSVRLVYVTPARQFPTAVTLSAPRRQALLDLTRRRGIPILEDDYNHEYCYRSLPTAPLAATPGASHVVYVGTLSKLIAPGVRVGFVAAAQPMLDELARWIATTSGSGDTVTQLALAHFIEDGALERHLWRTRRIYEERRDALESALTRHCPSLEFRSPDGGFALWGTCPGADSRAVAECALERGLSLLPEALVRVNPSLSHGLRLSFSRLLPAEAPRAARLLERVLVETSKVRHAARDRADP